MRSACSGTKYDHLVFWLIFIMSTAKPVEYLLRDEGSPTDASNRRSCSGSLWQGMMLTVAIAAVAFVLSSLPYLGFLSPMILAVFLGVIFHALVGVPLSLIHI